ncbi:MAG: metallophosphoesterase [Anaerolineae bacterium]|nr:metallophosphoesterase [Anaerolineae bacterium]
MTRPTYVIADIHGHYEPLIKLLKRELWVINDDLTWCGGETHLCFIGDYVNRGPDGLKVLDFLISLEIQAEHHGGRVTALLGNHEGVFLAAHRFGSLTNTGTGESFYQTWQMGGGIETDLLGLTPEQVAWITHLPAMVLIGDHLIMHADTPFYRNYGETIEAVNARFTEILRSFDPQVWDQWLKEFSAHRVFWREGESVIHPMLKQFGGRCIIHGHSRIGTALAIPDVQVTEVHRYAADHCIGIDGGITDGGPLLYYAIP